MNNRHPAPMQDSTVSASLSLTCEGQTNGKKWSFQIGNVNDGLSHEVSCAPGFESVFGCDGFRLCGLGTWSVHGTVLSDYTCCIARIECTFGKLVPAVQDGCAAGSCLAC